MKFAKMIRFATLLGVLACSTANASLIIGNSLVAPFSVTTNTGIKGAGFTIGPSSVTVTAVSVALDGTSCAANCTVEFDFYNNNSGVPGTLDAVVGTPTVAPQTGVAVVTLNPVGIFFAPNTTHWLVYKPGSTFVAWDSANPTSTPSGAFATFIGYQFDSTGTGTSYAPSTVRNSFSIEGTVSPTATPEPASLGLVLFGGALLLYKRRRTQ